MLSVRHNKLSNEIPWIALSSLPKLREIWLNNNYFNSIINSMTIIDMIIIRELSLSNIIPLTIHYLINLELLLLNNNYFIGNIPNNLHSLQKLRYFYFNNNQLSGKLR